MQAKEFVAVYSACKQTNKQNLQISRVPVRKTRRCHTLEAAEVNESTPPLLIPPGKRI